MALTADRRAALEYQLAEAEQAYLDMVTGKGVMSVGRDGRNVAYAQFVSDRDRLLKLINDLQVQLGLRQPRRMRGAVFR